MADIAPTTNTDNAEGNWIHDGDNEDDEDDDEDEGEGREEVAKHAAAIVDAPEAEASSDEQGVAPPTAAVCISESPTVTTDTVEAPADVEEDLRASTIDAFMTTEF